MDEDTIYKDVDNTIQLLWRLNIVKMKGQNYLLEKFSYNNENLRITYMQYNELLTMITNIDDSKEHLILNGEEIQLLKNEDILKLAWSSGLISGFVLEYADQGTCKIVIQPNVKYKIFEIIYFDNGADEMQNEWIKDLGGFVKHIYQDIFATELLIENGEKVVLQYKTLDKRILEPAFELSGILRKEYKEKDVYVYSVEI